VLFFGRVIPPYLVCCFESIAKTRFPYCVATIVYDAHAERYFLSGEFERTTFRLTTNTFPFNKKTKNEIREEKKMDRTNHLRANDIIFWQCNLFDFSWLTCQGGPLLV
jgi:hypothetical protein